MLVVAKPYDGDSVAEWALRTDGLDVAARRVEGDYGYSALWHELWEASAPFVLVEHDVVPWPGAVGRLAACPHPVCTHRYPLQDTTKDCEALGIVKVAGRAFDARLSEPRFWTGTELMVREAMDELGLAPHVHRPNVAHVKPPEGYTGPVTRWEVAW